MDTRLKVHANERVTELLQAARGGDQEALNEIIPLIYDELRAIAHRRLIRERRRHTLNTTALVHEAYLRLVRLDRIDWQCRAHFLAVAARVMRNILVNYALMRKRHKRGGGVEPVSLDEAEALAEPAAGKVLALNEALERLETLNPRQSRVVECRFFGGLTIEETAAALDVSPATVKRDWVLLRAWLKRELGDDLNDQGGGP